MMPAPGDVRMRGFRQRAELDEVQALIAGRVVRLPPEEVCLTAATGRVLASQVVAPVDVPGFRRAAMDGYALQAAGTFGATASQPLPFRLAGQSLPGRPFNKALGAADCVRIMTGAQIPGGADAIAVAESCSEAGSWVQVGEAVPPGKNIGRVGEDVMRGTVVLAGGRRLRPQDAAILASLGISPAVVVRRPSVEILITGDELLAPGSPPATGLTIDSNSVMLAALASRDGGAPLPPRYLADTAAAVGAALDDSRADVILVSGGSSVGVEDHAPQVLATRGELTVHGIAMRPASPAGVGFLPAGGRRPVFLLPGNPVSCLCAYDFLAGPAIRTMGGLPFTWPYPALRLPLAGKVVSAIGRVDYLRVEISAGQILPLAISGASILSSTVRADGFVVVPGPLEGYAAGTEVTVFLYDGAVWRPDLI